MAKLKIGSGIKMEVSMPESNTSPVMHDTKGQEACEAIAKTQELDKKLEDLGISLSIRVKKSEDSILEVMNVVNDLDMRSPVESRIIHPEVKAVTIHKDHNKELKNIQDSIVFLEDQTRTKIKSEINKRMLLSEKLSNALEKQKNINTMLVLGLIITTLLHLI